MLELADAVNAERRSVHASIFTDPEVYEAELSRIFGRSWLYVAHASQVAKAGDFVTAYMGKDSVVVARGKDGTLRVFLNSCPHKGARYCRQDYGNTKSFVCPYHVRTFETSGQLIGIAGVKLSELADVDHTGLIEVARVEEFEGLVFANFDPAAITLREHLGDLAWYLEVILAEQSGSRLLFEGVHRWMFEGNWKFPAEQSTGDPSHQRGVHRSMSQLGFDVEFGDKHKDFVVRFEHGHGLLNIHPRNQTLMSKFRQEVVKAAKEKLTPQQAELLGCLHVCTVFPNFEIVSYPGFLSVRTFQPTAPQRTEVWSWGVVPEAAPEAYANASKSLLSRYFSPTGVLEQDDVEIWEECARGLSGSQRSGHALHYPLPAKKLEAWAHLPGDVSAIPSEHANFGFFEKWQRVMSAPQR